MNLSANVARLIWSVPHKHFCGRRVCGVMKRLRASYLITLHASLNWPIKYGTRTILPIWVMSIGPQAALQRTYPVLPCFAIYVSCDTVNQLICPTCQPLQFDSLALHKAIGSLVHHCTTYRAMRLICCGRGRSEKSCAAASCGEHRPVQDEPMKWSTCTPCQPSTSRVLMSLSTS